jgi:hypothetical protein
LNLLESCISLTFLAATAKDYLTVQEASSFSSERTFPAGTDLVTTAIGCS